MKLKITVFELLSKMHTNLRIILCNCLIIELLFYVFCKLIQTNNFLQLYFTLPFLSGQFEFQHRVASKLLLVFLNLPFFLVVQETQVFAVTLVLQNRVLQDFQVVVDCVTFYLVKGAQPLSGSLTNPAYFIGGH
jgi:hypothetical protein